MASFNRRRSDALELGPSADAIALRLQDLKSSDDQVIDAASCYETDEYRELDALLANAYRTGDWAAYGAMHTRLIDEVLTERARLAAVDAQRRSWNDGADAQGRAA